MSEPLVIVGNGMPTARLVDELSRRALGRYAIAVVGAEPRLAYNRVLLSSVLAMEVAPAEIEEWFLAVYADALEWVELPNVHGMVMHADGGLMASKPYAASGAYINRMSDYCAGCRFDPKLKTGPGACPFNALYWNFLMENEKQLSRNPRMAMPYRNLKGMTADQRAAYAEAAKDFLESL